MKAAQLIIATCEEGQDFIPEKLKSRKISPEEKLRALNKWRENDKRGTNMHKTYTSAVQNFNF